MANETDYQPSGRPLTGRQVLAMFVAFFLVIFAANMTMLYFALNNFSGTVVKNAYVAGLDYDAKREAARAAPISRWSIQAEAAPGFVSVTVAEADGAPVLGAPFEALIGRPSHNREDRRLVLAPMGEGRYEAIADLEPGAWRLVLQHEDDGLATTRRFDVFVSEQAGQ